MVASLMAIAAPAGAQVQDTSSSCPSSIPSAGFVDLGGLDATTVQAIDCLAFYGISKGTSATTFAPTLSVPRWQMALFLTRQAAVHGVTLPDGSPQGFTDIGGLSSEAQTAINQLAQLNITKGTSATTFDPFGVVSRWQMALFISRLVSAAGITLPDGSPQGYTDIAGQSAEAQTAINQVTQLGIAQGTSATTFVPDAATLRWQMALFLTRTLAADGITPAVTLDTFLDGIPELVSVEEESFDSGDEELVLVYTFDEEIDFVSDEDQFHVYEGSGDQEEADDSSVDGDEVTVTFESIDQDIYDELTTAGVGQSAVEDTDGDVNPERSLPLKDATITSDSGELDNDADLVNLVDVTWEDNDFVSDTTEFTFEFDDDVTVADPTPGSRAALEIDDGDAGFFIVLTGGSTELDCFADEDTTDDEIEVVCDNAIGEDDWARGLAEENILDQDDGDLAGDVFQAVDETSSSHPDLVEVIILSDDRAEFVFDEQVALFGDVDDTDVQAELDKFVIYDELGNSVVADATEPDVEAIVTDSNRVVRVQFHEDPWGADTELDDDAEGGYILAEAVEERSGDEDPNARDEARVGAGDDVDIDAGDVQDPQLVSVSDIEESSTDLEGDADEWEVVFTFDEDLVEGDDGTGDCDPDLFRVYLDDGTIVEAFECETDNDEATATFDDDDVEDGLLAGVAWGAVFADDNDDENIEDSLPTEFAG